MSSFVYNFENLEDIIADKNCKFKIKQILNEINARNFESNSSEYLVKNKKICFLIIVLFLKGLLIHLMIKLLILKKMNF